MTIDQLMGLGLLVSPCLFLFHYLYRRASFNYRMFGRPVWLKRAIGARTDKIKQRQQLEKWAALAETYQDPKA